MQPLQSHSNRDDGLLRTECTPTRALSKFACWFLEMGCNMQQKIWFGAKVQQNFVGMMGATKFCPRRISDLPVHSGSFRPSGGSADQRHVSPNSGPHLERSLSASVIMRQSKEEVRVRASKRRQV